MVDLVATASHDLVERFDFGWNLAAGYECNSVAQHTGSIQPYSLDKLQSTLFSGIYAVLCNRSFGD